MSSKTDQIAPRQQPEGSIVRGRYEAVVTPSNFLAEGGIDLDNPTIGSVVDPEDDPADLQDAIVSRGSSSDRKVAHSGISRRELRVIDEFETKQQRLKAEYDQLVDSGMDRETARRTVLGKVPFKSK